MRLALCLVIGAVVMGCGAANAQSPLPKSGPMPAQGAPPASVFALPPAERFAATDVDKDGKVTKEEFKAVLNPTAQTSIERIWANRDTNKDGWLTAEEMNTNGAPARGGGGQRPPAAANAAAPAAAPAEPAEN